MEQALINLRDTYIGRSTACANKIVESDNQSVKVVTGAIKNICDGIVKELNFILTTHKQNDADR